MHVREPKIACPTCGKQLVRSAAPHFPFCSSRCRLLDLGKWLGGEHRIKGPEDGAGDPRAGGHERD